MTKKLAAERPASSSRQTSWALPEPATFGLKKAGDKSCKAYSVLQITSLNREEAAKNLAYTYMRENGYIKSADGSASER